MPEPLRHDGSVLRVRTSAKILVMDRQDRVLLIRFKVRHGPLAERDYWSVPGGAVEDGETIAQAALRELAEETGIRAASVGHEIDRRTFPMTLASGEVVLADERYFTVQVETASIGGRHLSADEQLVMAEQAWWTMDEIAASSATIWPTGLIDMLERRAKDPSHPDRPES